MLKPLPTSLFVQGQPLRASSWNRLVDGSVELEDAWRGEHQDGERHASVRLESAAMLLEWLGGDWVALEQHRVTVQQTVDLGAAFEVYVDFEEPIFWASPDYAVIAQGDDGVPGIVIQESKTPEGFVLVVPSGAGSPAPTKIAVVVYGRERGAE